MAGITGHWWLIVVLLIIVLIIWGPGKLPDVGAGMGRAIKEFRKASTETRDTIINATATPAPGSSAPNGNTPSETPAAAATPVPEPAPAGQPEEQKS
jgi:sec-independent protein translocase protein TatA